MESAPNDLVIATYPNLNGTQQRTLRRMWHHAVQTDADAIGWLPTKAFEVRSSRGDVTAIYRNDDLVGWAMHAKSKSRGVMKLYQIWIRPDARIIEHGRALITRLQRIAARERCHIIEAWVAEDLPANLFWFAIGFSQKSWRWGKGGKRRKHLLWQTSADTTIFSSTLSPEDSNGATRNRPTHSESVVQRMAETSRGPENTNPRWTH